MITALLLAIAAQTTRSTDRLPPANPLPLAVDDSAAGPLAAAQALLAALSAPDPATAVLAATRPDGSATAVSNCGVRHQSWAEFANGIKPGTQRLEEQLTDPAVEVDGDIAMVWSPYVFTVDGRVQHCGTDHFDLVREGGRWRVLNVTWTQRTTGC